MEKMFPTFSQEYNLEVLIVNKNVSRDIKKVSKWIS